MITNSSKSSYQYLRKVMVLPITFFIVTVVAVNCTAKDIKDVNKKEVIEERPVTLKQELKDLKTGVKDSAGKKVMELVIEEKKKLVEQAQNTTFQEVEVTSSFVGGEKGWREFLQKNLNSFVPVDKGAPEGKYTVITQFIVDQSGKISDLKALTHFGYGMEEEVLRVMKLSPDWLPAMQQGHPVKAYRRQPVTFEITSE